MLKNLSLYIHDIRSFICSWKRVPIVLQVTDTECGVACLASIIKYHGLNISLEHLRGLTGASRDGIKASTLLRIANDLGFDATPYKIDVAGIKQAWRPVIAYWNFNHYVVIERFIKGKFIIIDPANGRRSICEDEFDRSFTGVVIDIVPMRARPKQLFSNFKPPRWLGGLFENIWSLVGVLVLMVICNCMSVMSLVLNSVYMHSVLTSDNEIWLRSVLVVFSIISFLYIASKYLLHIHVLKLSCVLSIQKANVFIKHLLELPHKFFTLRQSGEINLLFNRLDVVLSSIYLVSTGIISSAILVVFILTFLALLNGIVTLFALVVVLCFCLLAHLLMTRIQRLYNNQVIHEGRLYTIGLSILTNIESIIVSVNSESILMRWRNEFVGKLNRIHVLDRVESLYSTLLVAQQVIPQVMLVVILGLRLAPDDNRGLSAIIFFFIFNHFQGLFAQLLAHLKSVVSLNELYSHVDAVFDYQPDCRYKLNSIHHINEDDLVIQASDLSFQFHEFGQKILNNLNFRIYSGEHIAIIGPSGSGKSTLARILSGLVTHSHGELCLGKYAYSDFHPSQLANYIAYMPQSTSLFTASLINNLNYFQTVDPNVLCKVLRLTHLQELVNEYGLNYMVKSFHSFSGGEKQRIMLAATLLQRTPIIILDEPTSSLDPEIEASILTGMSELNKTIIYIVHRVSAMAHCHRAIQLYEGCIVDQVSSNSKVGIDWCE